MITKPLNLLGFSKTRAMTPTLSESLFDKYPRKFGDFLTSTFLPTTKLLTCGFATNSNELQSR